MNQISLFFLDHYSPNKSEWMNLRGIQELNLCLFNLYLVSIRNNTNYCWDQFLQSQNIQLTVLGRTSLLDGLPLFTRSSTMCNECREVCRDVPLAAVRLSCLTFRTPWFNSVLDFHFKPSSSSSLVAHGSVGWGVGDTAQVWALTCFSSLSYSIS